MNEIVLTLLVIPIILFFWGSVIFIFWALYKIFTDPKKY